MKGSITKSKILNDYLFWLWLIVGSEGPISESNYDLLMRELLYIEFKWYIPNDDNRIMDGERLRDKFYYETGIDIDGVLNRPCSVLEMLVALAMRCEDDIMYDPDHGNRTYEWFWIMLKNLGLDTCTDADHGTIWTGEDVSYVVNRFVNREYRSNGVGGLFPLRHPKTDQRKVEVWYQMSEYLLENHYN